MALFGSNGFEWRETYFILFRIGDRPLANDVLESLKAHDRRIKVMDMLQDDSGRFESVTLLSPDDFAGMDISCVMGEEVIEQVEDLRAEIVKGTLSAEERRKLDDLSACDARFDIFHFEQVGTSEAGGESDFLDPGALLIVMEELCQLCHGIGVDPQAGSLM